MNILFVTWDGPQVTYLDGLFLPIFRELQRHGVCFHVLQFTWGDPVRVERSRHACEDAGVAYQAVIVRRWPKAIGALITALWGGRHVRKAIRRYAIDAVMPRSTLPGLAVLLGVGRDSCRIIFDADGLPLDERVDFAGQSPSSLIHRLLRDIEAQLARRADVVLTRSAKASQILLARAGAGTAGDKFFVVGNGRDVNLFHPQTSEARTLVRAQLGIASDAPLLVYAGSMGAQYCPHEMLRLFQRVLLRRSDARLLVLTQSAGYFQDVLSQYSIPSDSTVVHAVEAHQVPQCLASADLGLALRRPSFSMQGIAPIKLGEYLLCGLPVLATAGIGDAHVLSMDTGLAVDDISAAQAAAVADWFVDTVMPDRDGFRVRCRALGVARFSLDACVDSYARALGGLSDVR